MSAFESSRMVEAKAMAKLEPYIEEQADGRYILVDKGPLAKALQETHGDVMLNHKQNGRLISVEIKAEEKHTGRLFLETWSNLNIADEASFEVRGCNPGWLLKCHATLLFYYFIDTDKLYILRMHRLVKWAFGNRSKIQPNSASRLYDFKEQPQEKYQQLNLTIGHLVDIDVLRDEVGYTLVYPTQLEMFEEQRSKVNQYARAKGT